MILRHISDLHFGGGVPQDQGMESLTKHLEQVPDKGIVAITGDLVDGRNGGEWVKLLPYLSRIKMAGHILLIVKGNHDVGKLGCTYEPYWCDRVTYYLNILHPDFKLNKFQIRTQVIGGIKFIGLDTNYGNADDWFPPLARGELGKEQLLGLELELQDQTPTIILMHHKVYNAEMFMQLEDRESFLKLIRARNHIKYILNGHLHNWSITERDQTIYVESDNTTISHRYHKINLVDGQIEIVTF